MEITEEEEGGWPMEEGRALEGLEEGRFFSRLFFSVLFFLMFLFVYELLRVLAVLALYHQPLKDKVGSQHHHQTSSTSSSILLSPHLSL